MNAPVRRLALVLGSVAALGIAAACADSPSAPDVSQGPRTLLAAPAPAPPPPPPPPTCTPTDSVVAGYGNCSTGGLEYTQFEYEPETGTEYVATPDTTACEKGLTATTSCPAPTTTTTPAPPPPPPAPAPTK